MTWESFWKLVEVYGPETVLLIIAVLALTKGWVIPRGQYVDMMKEKDAQIQDAKNGESEKWEMLKPTIQVANAALDKIRNQRTR